MTQHSDLLLGALVADAACLGLHWIYNVDRIAEVTARQNGECAFTPVEARNFEGVKTFAHKARHKGMFTQIGEVLWLAIQSMNKNDGVFDVARYQADFAAHFGAGGAFVGFMDRPTRGTLKNLAEDICDPSGIDDHQTPALARLPAIVAAYSERDNVMDMAKTSMEITNVNPIAQAYNVVFAQVLLGVMQGASLDDVLKLAAEQADASIKQPLLEALASSESDSTVFAGINGLMGRACSLPAAGPVMFHILKHSANYKEAIERNILAGGDSAGRSILIGAVMGKVHGIATPSGIPLSWILELENAQQIVQGCERLGATA